MTESIDEECLSCGEGLPRNDCPCSKRECGHHCNHTWSHDTCDWCKAIFADPEGVTCQWYVLCQNDAVAFMPHVIIGAVPICQRCLNKHHST